MRFDWDPRLPFLALSHRDVPKVNCGEITRQKTSRKEGNPGMAAGTSQFIRVTEH